MLDFKKGLGEIMSFIQLAFGNALDRIVEFNKVYVPIKPGDVPRTYASTDALQEAVGY